MSRYELICQNIQTVMLGYNRASRRLARRIWRKHGIRSYVCDKRGSLWSAMAISFAFWKIPSAEYGDLVYQELLHLTSYDPSCIYIIVPCSDEYQNFLSEFNAELDSSFVISDPDNIFGSIPIFNTPNKK